eukprot:scpid48471/ scgid17079/ Asparagine synthetase [glutamine-hydrolyzing]; Glutamine-dependent asparagine synthetase
MCGIWALFGEFGDISEIHCQCMKLTHRGPDAWRLERIGGLPKSCIGFHRLSICSPLTGMQPLQVTHYPQVWLLYNGEIYNAPDLVKEYDLPWERGVDGEVIIHLYKKFGFEKMVTLLDGVFACTVIDVENRFVGVVRDLFGVRPLFHIMDEERGVLALSSEAKGLADMKKIGSQAKWFPPGHFRTFRIETDTERVVPTCDYTRYNEIGGLDYTRIPRVTLQDGDILGNIRALLKDAVKKRLMADRRIGCMLSGGLDSSLVTALMVECAKEQGLSYPIQTFSIGMEGSPDVLAARKVAAHLGTEHHEVRFTPQEGCEAVREVVRHLESYDITTVRASVGMYLVSKYIKDNTDTTVVFSGEGADELCQGYIYFHKAPSADEADVESRRLLQDLYMYDVLRSDRTTSAHSLEVRVPFLDRYFTSYILSLDKAARQPIENIEKHLLRTAFTNTGLLPEEILWRPKEAFSDGVSSTKKGQSWFELLQAFVEERVSDSDMAQAKATYPFNTPLTKEAFYYRHLFEEHYSGLEHFIPYFWMPRWTNATDPSARTLTHYKE